MTQLVYKNVIKYSSVLLNAGIINLSIGNIKYLYSVKLYSYLITNNYIDLSSFKLRELCLSSKHQKTDSKTQLISYMIWSTMFPKSVLIDI